MKEKSYIRALVICILTAITAGGCVERRITVHTEPAGAVVWLNDQEIGTSPATVSFSWYGDYRVSIRKEGYETLSTNRRLEAPLHDYFPFDLLATLYPGRILDEYDWHFELEPLELPQRDQLLKQADELGAEL